MADDPDGISSPPDEAMIELATRLFDMARAGDASSLAVYLDAGVPPNLSNDSGDSLIMLAAYHGHAETVRALLKRGADPDRLNDKGQAPVAGAVFKGETEVVRALVDGGADPAAGTPSAIEAAQMFGQDEMIRILRPEQPATQRDPAAERAQPSRKKE
jgi:hypothetical protein